MLLAFPETDFNKKAIFRNGLGDRSDDTRFEDRQKICEADTWERERGWDGFYQLQQLSWLVYGPTMGNSLIHPKTSEFWSLLTLFLCWHAILRNCVVKILRNVFYTFLHTPCSKDVHVQQWAPLVSASKNHQQTFRHKVQCLGFMIKVYFQVSLNCF